MLSNIGKLNDAFLHPDRLLFLFCFFPHIAARYQKGSKHCIESKMRETKSSGGNILQAKNLDGLELLIVFLI